MHEHRLPVASVVPASRVLSHIGVDDQAMLRRIAEAEGFVRLDFAEHLPATWGAWNVLVHRARDIGHEGIATGAVGHRHPMNVLAYHVSRRRIDGFVGCSPAFRGQQARCPLFHENAGWWGCPGQRTSAAAAPSDIGRRGPPRAAAAAPSNRPARLPDRARWRPPDRQRPRPAPPSVPLSPPVQEAQQALEHPGAEPGVGEHVDVPLGRDLGHQQRLDLRVLADPGGAVARPQAG